MESRNHVDWPIRNFIDEYRDYLQSVFRARGRALRGALEGELDRPLFLAQVPFYQAHRPFRAGQPWSQVPLRNKRAKKKP